ncbi:MAG: cytochrome B5 [Actinobacteria bacterium]|nr:cytochrome B5 [Actinomycetota bacterium]
MEKITYEQLRENDGSGGKPAWVAVDGIVYDVTESKRWVVGGHMGLHDAGKDLTRMLSFAPHGKEMLDRFSAIGELEE